MTAPSRTGGQILVDQLLVHGVDHIFCVPGESYLAALDALHDADIAVTVCRQEGGAAMMAEAYGKLTGRPGICFVTRGPGATNASPGLHIARQDSTPMILFVGQIERGMREREAFQELDYRAAFGAMVKWATEIDDPARFPEIVSRAFHVATSGRPGPVVIALPEDVLTETAAVADAPRYTVIESHPAPDQMAQLAALLEEAERPMALVGGSRWSKEAVDGFARFAADFRLPVACTFRRQMLFPADHPSYAGDLGLGVNPKLLERIRDADLILLVGGRLSEIPSQSYTLLDIPAPRQKLVHIHPDPSELGRVYSPHLAINASPKAFVSALTGLKAPASIRWSEGTEAAHAAYLSWSDPSKIRHPGSLQMGEVMAHLREALPADTIFCNGAGNFATWVHRFWPFRHYGTQLAPTSGSMGYGVPAAVGAKRVQPGSPVVVFAGDGDFLMNGQEFATAVQYDLPILVILVDNGMYGTIRMHQEREYPGRVSATMLKNPDFAAYAKAFGGYGERVETTEEFGPALQRALTSSKPAILHCILDPEAITPAMSLSQIREKALASRA
ncbi:thiamine pyrophosphate-binding protein [Microvirga thermotolerans]|uniref:Thiamine pyrophosphate-binding protein n=1 Tax=Microvirga thermotolerans TaxID=2651334 RepID=A0A5P9JUE8_9HYPH|nr:thiamine pyrophosphate-binding protein [Microvirga thermotolerans]QFU15256.1 thiamine pyrophosphate-binding protein [Microvirga thermotolerans]